MVSLHILAFWPYKVILMSQSIWYFHCVHNVCRATYARCATRLRAEGLARLSILFPPPNTNTMGQHRWLRSWRSLLYIATLGSWRPTMVTPTRYIFYDYRIPPLFPHHCTAIEGATLSAIARPLLDRDILIHVVALPRSLKNTNPLYDSPYNKKCM